MRVIIASDFHLAFNPVDSEQTERNESALRFLESLQNNTDMLILAGDIFDLWFDWKTTIIKGYFPFLKKLADLTESGCKLVFVSGNHDFWFGDFFTRYLQCDVHLRDYTGLIDGKNIFVSHGDLYTANDTRYRIYHSFIRHPVSRFIFSVIHPNVALSIGALASRTSRARTSSISESESRRINGLEDYARKMSDKYDIIVMGHSHRPVSKTINNSIYINTGYWGADNSYVLIDNGKAELLSYQHHKS